MDSGNPELCCRQRSNQRRDKTKAHAILIEIRETMLASMTSTLVDSLKEHSTTCDLSTQDKHAHLCTSWVTKVSVPINIIIIIKQNSQSHGSMLLSIRLTEKKASKMAKRHFSDKKRVPKPPLTCVQCRAHVAFSVREERCLGFGGRVQGRRLSQRGTYRDIHISGWAIRPIETYRYIYLYLGLGNQVRV